MLREKAAPGVQMRTGDVDRLVLATTLGWAAFTAFNALPGSRPQTVLLDVAVTTITAAMGALGHRGLLSPRVVVNGVAATSTVGLVLASWWSGDVEAIAWWYLVAVPLFVIHLLGRPSGPFWVAATTAACVVAVLDPLGFDPEFVPNTLDRAFGGGTLIAVTASFGWLARRAADERIDELTAAAHDKSELLATISHEIRTPLHGMLGVATVLAETSLSSDQRELITSLRASGQALNRIVDDVLDVSRLEVGKVDIHPEPVDLLRVLEDIVDLHAADAAAKALELALVLGTSDGFWVSVDETRVRQIVSNLVSNAIKFSDKGAVTLRAVARVVEDETEVEVRVEDTGPGIPEDRMDRLFAAYERLDTQLARIHGGTGLGLALARNLATRMGGTLNAERDRPVGACLILTLRLPTVPTPVETTRSGVIVVLEPVPLYARAVRSLASTMTDVQLVVVDTLAQAEAFCRGREIDAVVVCASQKLDPLASRTALGRVLTERTPIVLAVSASSLGTYGSLARSFAGTTIRPLRTSRLRMLLEDVVMTSEAPASRGTQRCALVIDDDTANRRILQRLLSNRNWEVIAVASAREGLAQLEQRYFDVVLCDLHMPEMDGLAFIRRAKEMEHKSYYIAATASVRETDRTRCREAGFDGFLRKPFEPAELEEVIGAAIRHARQSSMNQRSALPVSTKPLVDQKKWDDCRELFGDELDQVLEEHVAHVRNHLAGLRSAAADVEAVERGAHAIASGTSMLGLSRMGEAARALELGARDLDEKARLEAVIGLGALLDATLLELRTAPRAIAEKEQSPTILEVRFSGHLDRAMVERKLGAAGSAGIVANGMLVDCTEMSSYEAEARRAFETWQADHQGISRVAVLTHNGLWHAVIDGMGLVTKKRMRAFRELGDARAWLRKQG